MSVTTRRDRREQRRQRREHRTAPSLGGGRRISPLWIGLGAAVAAIAIVLVLGVVRPGPAQTFDLRASKYDTTNELVGTHTPDEGNSHAGTGEKVTYKQDPPTGGSHWGSPAAPAPWGIKDTTLPNEVIVHNLEHGGIVIFYKGLTDDETIKLKDLTRTLMQNGFPKLVLEPYPQMSDARIAISAWRWQLKLPGYDDVQIVKFTKQHYQGPDAPEPTVM